MYIALTVGIVLGWLFARRHTNDLLILFLLSPYRSELRFLELYDLFDSEQTFKATKRIDSSVKTYAEFLKLHKTARPVVYASYTRLISGLQRSTLLEYGVLALVLIPFHTIYFVMPLILWHVAYALYRIVFTKSGQAFFARTIVASLLANAK